MKLINKKFFLSALSFTLILGLIGRFIILPSLYNIPEFEHCKQFVKSYSPLTDSIGTIKSIEPTSKIGSVRTIGKNRNGYFGFKVVGDRDVINVIVFWKKIGKSTFIEKIGKFSPPSVTPLWSHKVGIVF